MTQGGVKMLNFLILVVGLILLVKCADVFVESSSKIARVLGIPALVIGLTIVAFGTSAPEAAVSLTAAIKGSNEISVGNVVGSNICNSLLILGLCGVFATLQTKEEVRKRDFPYYLLSAVVLLIITGDYFIKHEAIGWITRANGLVLLCFLAVYIYSLIAGVKREKKEKEKIATEDNKVKEKIKWLDIVLLLVGIVGIVGGGQLVVNGASGLARALGIGENVIALTIIAIGTSLPELVTSVIATRKGETDLAIGNVIGSNIFNILFILGLTASVKPIALDFAAFMDILFMAITSTLVFIMLQKNRRIGRIKGICMLAMYVLYMSYILVR